MTDCKRCVELERQLAEADAALIAGGKKLFGETMKKTFWDSVTEAVARQKQREQEER